MRTHIRISKVSVPFAASLVMLVSAPDAHAGLIIDNNLSYSNASVKSSDTDSSTQIMAVTSVGASFTNNLQVGWSFGYLSSSMGQGASTTKGLSGTVMGPRFGLFIGKSKNWNLAATWIATGSATYTSTGSTEEKWSGSGYCFEAGYGPEVAKNTTVGIKALYTAVNFSSSTNTSNTTSTVSYTFGGLTPALYLSFRF